MAHAGNSPSLDGVVAGRFHLISAEDQVSVLVMISWIDHDLK